MLLLVFADRYMGRAVEQDIGRLEGRIGIEAEGSLLPVLAGLFLELGHPVHPAEPDDAIENPGELGVGGHGRLMEYDRNLGIDARGHQGGGHLARLVGQQGRLLPHRDRVQIDHAIDAVKALVLEPRPIAYRAEIVAQRDAAGGLDSGKNAFHGESG